MNSDGFKWFIALSVAVHGVLLVLWRPPALELGHSGRVLQLAMAEFAGQADAAMPGQSAAVATGSEHSTPPSRKPLPSVPERTPASPAAAENRAAETPGAHTTHPPPSLPPAAAGGESRAAGSTAPARQETDRHLRKSLFELVTARLSYPALARRKGWQGTVRLELHIEPDGQITRLRIDASSGYPLLDQAAVRSLQLASVPRAGRWLNGHAIDIVIPVEYRLLDG